MSVSYSILALEESVVVKVSTQFGWLMVGMWLQLATPALADVTTSTVVPVKSSSDNRLYTPLTIFEPIAPSKDASDFQEQNAFLYFDPESKAGLITALDSAILDGESSNRTDHQAQASGLESAARSFDWTALHLSAASVVLDLSALMDLLPQKPARLRVPLDRTIPADKALDHTPISAFDALDLG